MNPLVSLLIVGLALAALFYFVSKNNLATNKKIEMMENYRTEKQKAADNLTYQDNLALNLLVKTKHIR
jgi:hypothetical protein